MTVDKYHPRCFLDIEIDGEQVGRICVELFSNVCPITCENFRALCTGEKGIGKTTEKPLHYKDAPFHRVVKNFVIQGGDFVAGNGTGGESIYGGQFEDENFDIPHDKPFLLSMSNRGKDSNGSQFFITTQPAPHLNGKHTVFGQVVSGFDVVKEIENIKTDQSCRPIKDVKIMNCGELVRQVKQKEKRRKSTESSASERDVERKSRKKKKEKHKKHKRERKEVKSSVVSHKEVEESGCMVDPEEIPEVPANNFLLRRTSPIGDNMRRSNQRESFNYMRPSRSRSGRKIKGRGFMRYRTPSRSTSRSGSETPPHWKQAQSRLRNIRDVVPPKPLVSPQQSQSEDEEEEEEDGAPKIVPLQSRLGSFSRNDEHRDARTTLHNKKNRNRSPDSPPWRNRSFGWEDDDHGNRRYQGRDDKESSRISSLQSKVVVQGDFMKNSDDKSNRDRFRQRPDISPRRRSPERDFRHSRRRRHSDSESPEQNKKAKGSETAEKEFSKKSERNFKSLADDLFKYRKNMQRPKSLEKTVKEDKKDEINKEGSRKSKKIPEERQKNLQSLASELFKYNKKARPGPGENKKKRFDRPEPRRKISSEGNDQVAKEPESGSSIHETEPKPPGTEDYARPDSSEESIENQHSVGATEVNRKDTLVENSYAEMVEAVKEHIPMPETDKTSYSAPLETSGRNLNGLHKSSRERKDSDTTSDDAEAVSSSGQPFSCNEDRTADLDGESTPQPVEKTAKEGGRWDKKDYRHPNTEIIQESSFPPIEEVPPPIPGLESFDGDLADIVPLPEESPKVNSKPGVPVLSYGDDDNASQQENAKQSPESKALPSKQKESAEEEPKEKDLAEIDKRKRGPRSPSPPRVSRENSKSPSPPSGGERKTRRSSKSPDGRKTAKKARSPATRSRSSSPSRKARSSPGRRTKARSRSKHRSPSHSRTKARSRSRSLSVGRTRTRKRVSRSPPRRSRSRGRQIRGRFSGSRPSARSPDRRGTYARRHSKSPGYRNRRKKSRSPVRPRRRRGRRSSSDSDSSSSSNSSSSSASRKRKLSRKRTKGRRSSSSSSSSSTKSGAST